MALRSYSIPGKVFLLGEYAVLAGCPALLAALPIRFQMKVSTERGVGLEDYHAFHPHAPIALCMQWAKSQGWKELFFQWVDPLFGAGGIGGSTAEYAMAYLACFQENRNEYFPPWDQAWNAYRQFLQDALPVPSGADLVCQWVGGVVLWNPMHSRYFPFFPFLDGSKLLVFSMTCNSSRVNKVQTHVHLQVLAEKASWLWDPNSRAIQKLRKILYSAVQALLENELNQFGAALDQYANQLQSLGLEAEKTSETREVLHRLPGVLGVKGVGAMQADAMIVCVRSVDDKKRIIAVAMELGLRLLSDGLLIEEPGITKHFFE